MCLCDSFYRRQGYFSQVIGNKAEDFGTGLIFLFVFLTNNDIRTQKVFSNEIRATSIRKRPCEESILIASQELAVPRSHRRGSFSDAQEISGRSQPQCESYHAQPHAPPWVRGELSDAIYQERNQQLEQQQGILSRHNRRSQESGELFDFQNRRRRTIRRPTVL